MKALTATRISAFIRTCLPSPVARDADSRSPKIPRARLSGCRVADLETLISGWPDGPPP